MSVDVKTIQKLIALCRKTGVESLEIDGVKLKLSPSAPTKQRKAKEEPEADEPPQLTEEDILNWSSGGVN